MQWKKLIKGIAFVIIFVVLFSGVSKVLTTPGDYRNYQWIAGFYEEPEDSLDAVYVSSSTGYSFWNSLVGWEQYGLTVYPYTCNSQHFITLEYLIREVRKTQPDALIIVNTNSIHDERLEVEPIHHLLDYMPLSLIKLQLTNRLVQVAGLTWEEAFELYVPLYRYHDRWSKLESADFLYRVDGLKGASAHSSYLNDSVDLTDTYTNLDERAPLADFNYDAAVSLMDYCEKENVRILFVTVPRDEPELRLQQINELNAMIEERGFDTLNLLENPELLGLDMAQDFCDEGHTNVHGSMKYTQYLAEYLIEHYGFTDKHGNEAYVSWDTGFEKYKQTLDQYILDFELDLTCRTTALEAPAGLTASAAGGTVSLTWESADGADGYAVYRKTEGHAWEWLADVSEADFTDASAESGAVYCYRVVPFVTDEGGTLYGKFDYKGVSVQTQ